MGGRPGGLAPTPRSRGSWVAAVTLIMLSRSMGDAQTIWDPNALPYEGPPAWQAAAVAALNRHLPTDSGYWVLGPLNLSVDLPDTTDLVRTTLRILAPDQAGARSITQRLRLPTGGVALEELQPSDTLPHELPPGYPGRFVKGSIVGEHVLIQVFTVNDHRWLLWAQRVEVAGIREPAAGPVARYARAVAEYLQAADGGQSRLEPPRAAEYGLDPTYDLYAQSPEPVVREREGYRGLLSRNRAFTLDDRVRNVVGFVPGLELVEWLDGEAPSVLFPDKDGEVALQHRYRDYRAAGGRWSGLPILSASALESLSPGRYIYVVDRYGVVRIGPAAGSEADGDQPLSAAVLAQGEPVRAAGALRLVAEPQQSLAVGAADIGSSEYFFSNLSLSLYDDVEERSDRYVLALGHLLKALDGARVPRDGILLRKF